MNDMTEKDYNVYTWEHVKLMADENTANYLVRGPLGDSFAWCYTPTDAQKVCDAMNKAGNQGERGFRVEWDGVGPAEFLSVKGGAAKMRAQLYADLLTELGYVGVRVVPATTEVSE